jgi:DNA-binding NarL/FixJ family response regulator
MEKHFELTKEESNIINLLTEGYRVKEIGAKTGRGLYTTTLVIEKMKRRYKCRTSVQLIAKILRDFIYE